MKFGIACALFSTMALLGPVAKATIAKTSWSHKRVQSTKHRLERNFGKGLVGLINEDGHVDPDRLGWMVNKHNGKKPLGSTSEVIFTGLPAIDATNATAQVLGFVNGLQYTGLVKEGDAVLPTSTVPLTNCFAATYSLLEDFDIAGYNIQTFTSEPGTIKIFDVLAMDTSRIFMDSTVTWE